MTIAPVIFVDVVGLIALLAVIHLVRCRLLSIGIGLSWFLVIGALMLAMTVPGVKSLWVRLSLSLFDSPPYVIALTAFLLVFLLYQSVTISRLQRQVREIGQFVALNQGQNYAGEAPEAK